LIAKFTVRTLPPPVFSNLSNFLVILYYSGPSKFEVHSQKSFHNPISKKTLDLSPNPRLLPEAKSQKSSLVFEMMLTTLNLPAGRSQGLRTTPLETPASSFQKTRFEWLAFARCYIWMSGSLQRLMQVIGRDSRTTLLQFVFRTLLQRSIRCYLCDDD
jgi:hypothetical protein